MKLEVTEEICHIEGTKTFLMTALVQILRDCRKENVLDDDDIDCIVGYAKMSSEDVYKRALEIAEVIDQKSDEAKKLKELIEEKMKKGEEI